MRRSRPERPCIYCGRVTDPTDDHVPPKLLLERPYPPNLLTVPACLRCNRGFARDDEYLRTTVSLHPGASATSAGRLALDSTLRALARPDAAKFAAHIRNHLRDSLVLDSHGKPAGQSLDVDKNRINAAGSRMVRAFHYGETGVALSSSAKVKVGSRLDVGSRDAAIQTFAQLYFGLTKRSDREFGDALSYAAGFGDGFSIWLLLLYGTMFWVGTATEAQQVKDEPSRQDRPRGDRESS
jgi:hypothetical protein